MAARTRQHREEEVLYLAQVLRKEGLTRTVLLHLGTGLRIQESLWEPKSWPLHNQQRPLAREDDNRHQRPNQAATQEE